LEKGELFKSRKYSISHIFDLIDYALNCGKIKIRVGGDTVKITQTILTFFFKGVRCKGCRNRGRYFIKEYDEESGSYYLSLYALDKEGKHRLMTKDHIIPKSKKGRNNLRNYQPMCTVCNSRKADKFYHGGDL
jgi:hypothetical protein